MIVNHTSAGETFDEQQGGSNNSAGTASNIQLGKTYIGQLALDDKCDYYRFTLKSATRIAVTVTPTSSAKAMQIESASFYVSDSADKNKWSKTASNFTNFVDLQAGTYYFSAFKYNSYTGSYSFTLNSQPFTDVSTDTPHYEDIIWLADQGISTGWTERDGTRTFRGGDTVKRQDMAAFLYRLAGSPAYSPSASDRSMFRDVNSSTPHAKEIWWLAHYGISTGWKERDGSRTFRGGDIVRRQDMAAFLHRLNNLR